MHSYIPSQYDFMPCNHHVNTSIPHALTYHFSHTIHAIHFKQQHASNTHGQFQSKSQFWTVQNSPNPTMDCQTTVPSSSIRSHLFGTEMYNHSRPHNSQNHFHGFLDKNNRLGENPYLLEFVKTPRFRSLLEALSARKNFASCSDPNRQFDRR